MTDSKRDSPIDIERGTSSADTVVEPAGGRGSGQATWSRYRSWLEKPAVPAPNRHAAITRSLYSWANYKSWADKVRSDWDKDA